MTSSTYESTMPDTLERARRMAPPLLGRTNALLDELEWSRVELQRLQAQQPAPDPDKALARKLRAAHARESRTADLHTAIDVYVEKYRKQLRDWTDSKKSSRAKWLARLMKADAGANDAVPHWRYIESYINTMHF
ncbi:hypothetical protein [Pseudomonas sp. VI4.1]|uniref:hypothetical protein n=1 Tax=Pseudomonas sp. VI4.1 TaxID=1941346 RepID=UPI0009D32CA2|nr:hypothetical protein [Pseudomonas sp. VI4.1]OPK06783.1 hypothetical protein BZ163_29715 [Pseudomonas sp. VI4.1]